MTDRRRDDVVRVGAIDCGTNSVRLLIADLDVAAGRTLDVARESRMVRLGQGVDATGRLAPEALERTFAALDEYAALLRAAGVASDRLRFCATSAARDADNSAEFTAGVRARLGVDPEVVAGDEEARLSYDGATRPLPGLAAPVLVIDIGGGSTELVLGAGDGDSGHDGAGVRAAVSLDVGAVRLTERHLHADPPTVEQVAAAAADVDRLLDGLSESAGLDVATAATVVGVAGTITTTAAITMGLTSYDHDRIHHAEVSVADVRRTIRDLLGLTVQQRRALGPMHPRRADVIGGGVIVLDRVLARTGADRLRVSETDILDGIAWSVVG